MAEFNKQKAPFPYFGGKSKAAPLVWELFGDVDHYVEPFAGSLAVLLGRPHLANRAYHSETVNDLDCLLVNAWRAIQFAPDETAAHCSWPVTEADKMARHLALVRWRESRAADHLRGDAAWFDVQMAGWWLWGIATAIGATWCAGGPWTADADGFIYKQDRQTAREPGVSAERPHLGHNGQGVNRSQLREPGVSPFVLDSGQYHPMTMPKLTDWFAWLSARLRHVRIVNGDWQRVVKPSVTKMITVRMGDGTCGVFLDPPYTLDPNIVAHGLYNTHEATVADDVREWCLKHGDDPDLRIVLAGFDTEHADQMTGAGWTEHEWFNAGFLTGGMAQQSGKEGVGNQDRERLWASPHCLEPNRPDEQIGLF